MTAEPIAVALQVVDALEQLGVPCFIAGSLASTLHGEPRVTLDSDLVAALRAEHVGPLVKLLRNEFYVDEAAVRAAMRDRRCGRRCETGGASMPSTWPRCSRSLCSC